MKFTWREFTEKVVTLGAAIAEFEYRFSRGVGKNIMPTPAAFKERTLLRSKEIVNGREPFVRGEFSLLLSFFNQSMILLAKGEDPTLERIIDNEYEKLKK